MATIVTDKYIENDVKVIELDSWSTLVIDVIRESIEIVNKFNADIGKISINGVDLKIKNDDLIEDVYANYRVLVN